MAEALADMGRIGQGAISTLAWLLIRLGRLVLASSITLAWIGALCTVGAFFGRSLTATVLVVLGFVIAAVASFLWLPRLSPGLSDWKRWKQKKAHRQARIAGYQHCAAMGVIAVLDADTLEWAMKNPVRRLPDARLVVTPETVSLFAQQTVAATDDTLQSKAEAYAPVLNCSPDWVRVERISAQTVRLVFPRVAPVDPLDTSTLVTGSGILAEGIPCGVQADGAQLLASFANQSGAVVGGVPGSGKSAGATSILAQLSSDSSAQFVVIDGKGGSDWAWLEPRASLLNTDDEDLESVKEQLIALTGLMRHRLQTQKEVRGTSNFWHAGATEAHPFVLVVIDECQSFFDPKEHMAKEAKQLSQEIAALTVNLVKKGRSAGVFVMSITQKPTSDSIPSALSANCGVKWACRVETRAAEESILGLRPDGTPEAASPTLIPETRPGGVTVKRGGMWVRARFAYTPEAEAASIAQQYAGLRIPFDVLVGDK